MEANIYQLKARQYAKYSTEDLGPFFTINGIMGNVGNLSSYFKQLLLFKGTSFNNDDIENIKYILGDILWYVSNFCSDLDIKLNDVMETNLNMLPIALENIKKIKDKDKEIPEENVVENIETGDDH